MAKDKDGNKEEEFIMVGDGVEEESELADDESSPGAKEEHQEGLQDKRQGHSEEDDDSEEDDSESGEQPSKAGKRKQERLSRKQRQRESRDRDRRELDFLRQRNEQLERRFSAVEGRIVQNEKATIDQRLGMVRTQMEAADEVIAAAINKGQGSDVVEAQKIRDNLVRQETLLLQAKRERNVSPQPQTSEVDPEHLNHARNFLSKNSWINLNGSDKDSKKVQAIDNQVLQEGYDPSEPDYWEELEKRLKKQMPHRFKSRNQVENDDSEDEDEIEEEAPSRRDRPRGGPTFRSGGRDVPLKKGQVYVSRERREAMEEAGVWDDPVLRRKFLASYAKYDRENSGSQGNH